MSINVRYQTHRTPRPSATSGKPTSCSRILPSPALALAPRRNWPKQCRERRSRSSRLIEKAPKRTWIWSALHLADRSILLIWNRPFRSIEEMNRHLLARWSERVGAGDTINCVGDVGHPDAWRDRRLVVDVRDCPGRRLLVLGNHDGDIERLPSSARAPTPTSS